MDPLKHNGGKIDGRRGGGGGKRERVTNNNKCKRNGHGRRYGEGDGKGERVGGRIKER